MAFEKKTNHLLGVDVGGSHITAALIDLANGCTIEKSYVRNHVPTHGEAEEILQVWTDTIATVFAQVDDLKKDSIYLGIAMPGPFDYVNGISLITGKQKYESLFGVDIRSYLAQRLELSKQHISFKNDAEAFLHGEANCGAVKGFSKSLGITLGTGLGSAIHLNNYTVDADLNVLPFLDSTAEEYLSTRWFVKRYFELSGNTAKDAKQIFLLADRDPIVIKLIDEFSTNLANFLYGFIAKENPQAIVIGGNIAQAHLFFLKEVKHKLHELGSDIPIMISALWEDAAMIGAVYDFEKHN